MPLLFRFFFFLLLLFFFEINFVKLFQKEKN